MIDSELIRDRSDTLAFSAKRKKIKQTYQLPQQGGNLPWRPSRRQFIGLGVAAGIGGTAWLLRWSGSGSTTEENDPYQGWARYRDGFFPAELVEKLASDIATLYEYPGFPETGRLILRYHQNPALLKEVHPAASGTLRFGLANLIATNKALGMLRTLGEGRGVAARIRDKATGQTQVATFVETAGWTASVLLDNGFYWAPKAAQRLVLVKETSQLAYISQFKRLMTEEVTRSFDVTVDPPKENLPAILYDSSVSKSQVKEIPDLTFLFNEGQKIIDGAGFFHTTPAFGKMWRQNLFGPQALETLNVNYGIFRSAWDRGLLMEKEWGNFIWRKDVSPFSLEWYDLIKPLLSAKTIRLP